MTAKQLAASKCLEDNMNTEHQKEILQREMEERTGMSPRERELYAQCALLKAENARIIANVTQDTDERDAYRTERNTLERQLAEAQALTERLLDCQEAHLREIKDLRDASPLVNTSTDTLRSERDALQRRISQALAILGEPLSQEEIDDFTRNSCVAAEMEATNQVIKILRGDTETVTLKTGRFLVYNPARGE